MSRARSTMARAHVHVHLVLPQLRNNNATSYNNMQTASDIMKSPLCLLLLLVLLSSKQNEASAWVFSPLERISKDFSALTRRVTARHILMPSAEACIVLKQQIRNKSEERYIVQVFERAAKKYSQDNDTAARGGLLGELMPQGYCRSEALDRACFQVRLGIVEGPIETEYGHHLLLVTERTNCPKLDGPNTKLILNTDTNKAELVPSDQVGQVTGEFAMGQVLFWMFALVAGGIVAEVAAQVGDTVSMRM